MGEEAAGRHREGAHDEPPRGPRSVALHAVRTSLLRSKALSEHLRSGLTSRSQPNQPRERARGPFTTLGNHAEAAIRRAVRPTPSLQFVLGSQLGHSDPANIRRRTGSTSEHRLVDRVARVGCDDAGVVAFRLPANLSGDARGDRGEWLLRLPAIVGELADRWSLRLGDPYEPGGSCSWVAPAHTSAGLELVLKVGWRHNEVESEADGLRAWQDHGAVVLHDAHACGATSALLLERCRPGTPLGQAVGGPEQDVVIAGLLSRLWSAPAEGFEFRSLQVMCDTWAAGFHKRHAGSSSHLDPGLVQAGMELWRELPGTAKRTVLLATDLHAGNVLASQREPWLVIDPKPYLGDPAYDALQHMLNCDRLRTEPWRLAKRMATLLELDPERVTQWLFARCVYESLDQPELARVAAELAPK